MLREVWRYGAHLFLGIRTVVEAHSNLSLLLENDDDNNKTKKATMMTCSEGSLVSTPQEQRREGTMTHNQRPVNFTRLGFLQLNLRHVLQELIPALGIDHQGGATIAVPMGAVECDEETLVQK